MSNKFEGLPVLKAPYKSSMNQRYTKQLFYEMWNDLPNTYQVAKPPFTLNADIPGLINFGRRYVMDADPSGYTTAMALLGEYEHFQLLMRNCAWFREAKEQWDKEIEAKLYAEGLAKIRELAKGEDAKALQAAKVLINSRDYKPGKKTAKVSRGRPTNEEVEGHLKKEAEELKELHDDLARIQIVKR